MAVVQTASQARTRETEGGVPAGGEFEASLANPGLLRAFYEREGYAVVRGAVPAGLCTEATAAFARDVLSDRRSFFLRHESDRYERHVLNEDGFMKYPILSFADLGAPRHAAFRNAGLRILTHETVQRVVAVLLGEKPRLINNIFFDGNQTTWAHRDRDYISSAMGERMIGIVVAAEDIHPGAGRFFVHPGTHRSDDPETRRITALNPNGREYKEGVRAWLDQRGRDPVAPVLKRGDMVVFSSGVIHGSLPTTVRGHSRRTFNAHFIADSEEFVLVGNKKGRDQTVQVNGVRVSLHGDQSRALVQVKARLAADHPGLWKAVRDAKRRLSGRPPAG